MIFFNQGIVPDIVQSLVFYSAAWKSQQVKSNIAIKKHVKQINFLRIKSALLQKLIR